MQQVQTISKIFAKFKVAPVTGSWSFWSLKSSKIVFCYRFSQKLLGRLTPNFDTMYLVTPDVHNKLLVVIRKRAPEPLPVEKKFFAQIFNQGFQILNVVSTNHFQNFCKILSCSGDRKLEFLEPKKLKSCFFTVFLKNYWANRHQLLALYFC